MSNQLTWVLLVLALLIIAILGLVAWRLQLKLRAQQREQERQQAIQSQKKADRQAFVLDSLRMISANVIDEDLNLSEATIRCKILVDALELNEAERRPYLILEEVYERIQHFDTHETRRKLDSDERSRQDDERERIEAKYREPLIVCFKRLRTIQ